MAKRKDKFLWRRGEMKRHISEAETLWARWNPAWGYSLQLYRTQKEAREHPIDRFDGDQVVKVQISKEVK